MAHGYLRDYDEAPNRDEERDRWRDEERNFMFGDRDRGRGAQDRFREDDRQYRNTHEDRWASRDHGSGNQAGQRNFASHQDDHYRNWRDRQMQALDRDYEDYCREREQQFHRDFDSWRQNRGQNGGQQREQQAGSANEDELVLTTRRAGTNNVAAGTTTDALAASSPEETTIFRPDHVEKGGPSTPGVG